MLRSIHRPILNRRAARIVGRARALPDQVADVLQKPFRRNGDDHEPYLDQLVGSRGILVSFCNVRSVASPVLGAFDTGSRNLHVVLRCRDVAECTGFTGLAVSEEHIFAVAQLRSRASSLYVFARETLRLAGCYPLCLGQDVHSVALAPGTLFAVSTGTDEVLQLRREGATLSDEEVVWRPDPDVPRADTHHLNGLVYHDGQLVVSGFGRREGEMWTSARSGRMWELNSKCIIRDGIEHPHSPVSDISGLMYCDSRRMAVQRVDSSPQLPGYARGLCLYEGQVFVGTSEGRKVSKSTGIVNNPTGPGRVAGVCSISRLIPGLELLETTDLSSHGSEIYDLVPW